MKAGLTGGIGSGKTTAARIFAILGVPVFYADTEGKRLMEEDAALIEDISGAFGAGIYRRENGRPRLERKQLAAIVFDDPGQLDLLNSLVHPAVFRAFDAWASRQEGPYVLKESALLFETDAYRHVDVSIMVTAPEEERIRRVIERDGVSRRQVADRMQHQLSEEEKARRADFRLVNDNSQLLIPQVLDLHSRLLSLAAESEDSRK